MKLYSENKDYKLYHGNMLDMLKVIKPNTIDSVVTDPPYELNFMGKGWDNSGIAFQDETWKKCYEVLKPGGYLLAFGGSRTFHRIACAIENAGFEIRDIIMWLYGSGFPKSMNIGLAIDKRNGVESKVVGIKEHCKKDFKVNNLYAQDVANRNNKKCFGYGTEILKEAQNKWKGWGTCLKPSFEPIIVARKPFKGSLVDNVIQYGVGGINVDECRIGVEQRKYKGAGGSDITIAKGSIGTGKGKELEYVVNGRFPANTILTYDENDFDEVCGGMPHTKSTKGNNQRYLSGANNSGNFMYGGINENNFYNDSGNASRYFYCAKASKKDRDEGLEKFECKESHEKGNGIDRICEFCGVSQLTPTLCMCEKKSWIAKPRKNVHPTVKPTELMQYLVRLVNPDGATILDCFNGSGSTGKAVMYENKENNKHYKYVGIELLEEYLQISKARIEYVGNL